MKRALIVIDVQKSFQQRENWAAVSNPQIVKQVNRLVDAARAAGDMVVWVLHTEPGSGTPFDPASGHVTFMEGVEPLHEEHVVTKTSKNAFTTTNMQQTLTANGIGELIVCGIQTEQCCETTARIAADFGFEVTFVTDATATFPIPHRDTPSDRELDDILSDPATLTTDEIVSRTEYALSGRFATIKSVDEVVGASA